MKRLILTMVLISGIFLNGVANAVTITFSEIWNDPPQSMHSLVGDEWSTYGILMQNVYWYADSRDPWSNQHGVTQTSNPGIISFIAPTDSVTIDWVTISSQDIKVKAYNASNILLDSFYYAGSGTSSGTHTLTGTSIAYLHFYDNAGEVGISTLTFQPVPEPSTFLLLGAGLVVGVGFLRKRIKR